MAKKQKEIRLRELRSAGAIEMRMFFGKGDLKGEYLLVRVRRRGRDHHNAFAACELKAALLDILGREDSTENRRVNDGVLLRELAKVWKTS